MTNLLKQAKQAQLVIIKDYILKCVSKGETKIELFDWNGCYSTIFEFVVTKEHLTSLSKEMNFTISSFVDKFSIGIWRWKEEFTSEWFTIQLN